MKRHVAIASLVLLFSMKGFAAAVTYGVSGGNLVDWLFWNKSTVTGEPAGRHAVTFDGNGALADDLADQGALNETDYSCQVGSSLPLLNANCAPGGPFGAPRPWLADGATAFTTNAALHKIMPPSFDATYSGEIIYDDATQAVIGGTFTATGTLAYHLSFPNASAEKVAESLIMPELINMSWNLATGVASGSTDCNQSDLAVQLSPIFCSATTLSKYNLVGGLQGITGVARPAVSFDPGTGQLRFFTEGFTTLNENTSSFEIDNEMVFTVTAAEVPVPPALALLPALIASCIPWVRRRSRR